jgi:hypothetical protein
MSDVDKLDSDIAKVAARLRVRSAELKTAQDQWDDWRAGSLRQQVGADQILLHNLRLARERAVPLNDRSSRAIFTGSNF